MSAPDAGSDDIQDFYIGATRGGTLVPRVRAILGGEGVDGFLKARRDPLDYILAQQPCGDWEAAEANAKGLVALFESQGLSGGKREIRKRDYGTFRVVRSTKSRVRATFNRIAAELRAARIAAAGIVEDPFNAKGGPLPRSSREVPNRPYQVAFRDGMRDRCGSECVCCHLSIPDALEAAHLIGRGPETGTDDLRNGLLMCCNHHRMFDRRLFAFDPDTGRVVHAEGFSLAELQITKPKLELPPDRMPHSSALRHARARFEGTR